jgi:hypothetical protein
VKKIIAVSRRLAALPFKGGILLLKIVTERLFFLGDPTVTFSTLVGWRYPVFLINSLAGVSVVGVHWRDTLVAYRMLPFRTFLFRLRIASLLPPARRGTLIYDAEFGRDIRCVRRIALEKRYYLVSSGNGLYIYPYFAHPTFYLDQLWRLAQRLSAQEAMRPTRLFFSGTVQEEHYAGVDTRFSILGRPVIIDHLMEALRHPENCWLNDNAIIIVTADVADSVAKHFMTPEEFLRACARTDFFLCPPGCGMPQCHNMVEAMSAGAIPITNYHDFMTPPLTHNVNCLAFDTLADLDAIIHRLSSIEARDIEQLRAGAKAYYAEFLEMRRVGERFLQDIDRVSALAVNDEGVSRYWDQEKWLAKKPKAGKPSQSDDPKEARLSRIH